MEKYVWLDVNFTSFEIIDSKSELLRSMVKEWMLNEFKGKPSPLVNEKTFSAKNGLIFDSVLIVAETLSHILNFKKDVDHFFEELKLTRLYGSTGYIDFDKKGLRKYSELHLISLNRNGLEKVGVWSPEFRLNVTKRIGFEPLIRNDDFNEQKRHLRIAVVNCISFQTMVFFYYLFWAFDKKNNLPIYLEKPYVSFKNNSDGLHGNDRFEGFCIDLLDALAELCNFNYTIHKVSDNKYGTQNKNGEWNGLVKEIIDNKADMALASLTINLARSKAIYMTKPFLNLGLSILFKQPEPKPPKMLSFLAPLSSKIWTYMFLSYLITSLVMFINARISPNEWLKVKRCGSQSDLRANQFTFKNSFWYTITSFLHMGIDISPHSVSTRLLNCTWSLFTLILTASYTANLAAFLTVKIVEVPIKNAEDLSLQSEISYGCLSGGSSETFFKVITFFFINFLLESKIVTYERMWKFMSEKNTLVTSTQIGIEKVKKGNFAFLLESTSNEYARERNCDLIQVGDLLDSKSYGLGLRKDLEWNEEISNAVIMLQERGVIQKIHEKWWKLIGSLNCHQTKSESNASPMKFQNIRGIFLVLGVGLAISCAKN
ncbi:Glutamate receptor kainate 2 [Brachionus plicatilis]|uniref:Glutamate receptor kainate 2 n=1 Tax=Brachionus plicatilis TaxID=10195 RepID=A0A3M7R3J8_BRAPC|nr:Glutamate receptor kainate 2 [Brachionus plicatilis]